MKTAIYTEIDGLKIVRGIGDRGIDGVETQNTVKPLIEATDEFTAVKSKKTEIGNRAELMVQEKAEYRRNYAITQSSSSDTKKAAALTAMETAKTNYNVHSAMIEELQKDIEPLVELWQTKSTEIFDENKVYFDASKNEIEITVTQAALAQELLDGLADNELLTTDKEVITDNRGLTFWSYDDDTETWSYILIESLTDDVPDGGFVFSDLTEDQQSEIVTQIETERLAALTDDEKTAEQEALIAVAVASAATMKTKLEIQGDDTALETAQTWYAEQVAAIEAIYT